ncbi:hypothetical protein GCM10027265_25690 [Jatrophihabitans fulvus]
MLFAMLLVLYAVYSAFVVTKSWVGDLDRVIYDVHIKRDHLTHGEYRTVYWYLTIGQRAPVLLAFAPYFAWITWRRRTITPLVTFVVAQLLLNLSVGVVKLGTGRIGPKETADVFRVFDGGNIYPSGHVSNAVVIWGLLALSVTPKWRRVWTAIAIWVSFSVGIGTVMINTHWFSDIVGGWFAGGLVLFALPWVVPAVERLTVRAYDRYGARIVPRRLRSAIAAGRTSADGDAGQFRRPVP